MRSGSLVSVVLLLLPVAGVTGVAGWTAPAAVMSLEASDFGRFIVRLAVDKNVSGCRDATGFYADYGRDGSELMHQSLSDALIHGRNVQVQVTGACDLKGLSAISSVRILP